MKTNGIFCLLLLLGSLLETQAQRVDVYHHQPRVVTSHGSPGVAMIGIAYYPQATYYLTNDPDKTNAGKMYSIDFTYFAIHEEENQPIHLGFSVGYLFSEEVEPEWYIYPELADDFLRSLHSLELNLVPVHYFNALYGTRFNPYVGGLLGIRISNGGRTGLNAQIKTGFLYKSVGLELGYSPLAAKTEKDRLHNAIAFEPDFSVKFSILLYHGAYTSTSVEYD